MRLIPEALVAAALCLGGCMPWAAAQEPEGGKQSVTGAAGAIYVDDGGGKDGLPVVLLHAFGGDSSHWASQLSHLRHHRRALAIDLRGHGKSAAPRDGNYSIDAMARDVEAVVDKLEIPRFVLVGHSLGGAVAIRYAGRHPNRVAGLVMVGAPGKIPEAQSKPILASMESDYDRTMKDYWEKLLAGAQPNVRTQVLQKIESVPKDDSLAIMRALFADDPLASLDRYKGPKLIVYTSQGNTPNDLQNARPTIPSVEMPGTSHWPQLDKPGEFDRVLDEFLMTVK